MYKIEVARVKLSDLISKSKFINTNRISIHLFLVMHLYSLQYLTIGTQSINKQLFVAKIWNYFRHNGDNTTLVCKCSFTPLNLGSRWSYMFSFTLRPLCLWRKHPPYQWIESGWAPYLVCTTWSRQIPITPTEEWLKNSDLAILQCSCYTELIPTSNGLNIFFKNVVVA
jgi:hypothetical protein